MSSALHISHTNINTDSRILKEMHSLASAGLCVHGIGVDLKEGTQRSKLADELNIDSIEVYSNRINRKFGILKHISVVTELSLKMFYRSFRLKPDVIHCHDTLVLPLGVILKLITGAKLIYDAHELESDRNGLGIISGFLTLSIERLSWPIIDKLIVVSPSIEKWYNENVGKKASEVIFNSPLLENTLINRGDYFNKKFKIDNSQKIFIYIGILAEGRGIEKILELFSSKKSEGAVVVFLGYGNLANTIVEHSKKSSRIFYHEPVAHEKVVEVVQSADVGFCLIQNISLSDYYSLPNKLFEYSFAGLQVIASNFPDISEVVKCYDLGVTIGDESLCSVLDYFLDEEHKYVADLEKIRPLSWQEQQNKLVNLYKDIL